ncbi:MAG: hypothetical protein QGF46_07860, partial [Planctomycetota bacterium]|nr:hypothetical protein [Planctomycetota bacterium]
RPHASAYCDVLEIAQIAKYGTLLVMKNTFYALFLAILPIELAGAAQNTVFSDDFDNGVTVDEWQLTYQPFMLWDFVEFGSNFSVYDMGTTFGGSDTLSIERSFSPRSVDFTLTGSYFWTDNMWVPTGFSHLHYSIEILNQGSVVASLSHIDSSQSNGGSIGGSAAGVNQIIVSNVAAAGTNDFTIERDVNNNLTMTLVVSGTAYSHNFGALNSSIDGLRLAVTHTTQGGPGRDMLAETHTDFLTLVASGGNTGPVLSVQNAVAGSVATMIISQSSPNSPTGLAYSRNGAGPISTPYGLLPLTPPINILPTMFSDSQGTAVWNKALPASSSGLTVWMAGIDLATSQLSNGVAVVVQ